LSGKTEVNERMKTNMTAGYLTCAKYGQTANVKPQAANRGFPFVVRIQNLDLKVSSSIVTIPTSEGEQCLSISE